VALKSTFEKTPPIPRGRLVRALLSSSKKWNWLFSRSLTGLGTIYSAIPEQDKTKGARL